MSIILVMGIPGAGKSTFCRKMREGNEEIVASTSFDDYRQDKTFERARDARQSFEQNLEEMLSSDFLPRVILIEDTFHLKSMRRQIRKMAKRLKYHIGIVYIKIDIDLAIERNRTRSENKKQLEETIHKIFETLEKPEEFEKMVEIYEQHEMIENMDELMNKLNILNWNQIEFKKKSSTKIEEKEKIKVEKTNAELWDIITRRLVTEIIKSESEVFDQKMLCDARKNILKQRKFECAEISNSLEFFSDIKNSILNQYFEKINEKTKKI